MTLLKTAVVRRSGYFKFLVVYFDSLKLDFANKSFNIIRESMLLKVQAFTARKYRGIRLFVVGNLDVFAPPFGFQQKNKIEKYKENKLGDITTRLLRIIHTS